MYAEQLAQVSEPLDNQAKSGRRW